MHPHRGFTLIEILIVMLIISIIAGVATLTIRPNPRKEFEAVANRFNRVILLAEQEAMLRPATLGLGMTAQHYQFFIFIRDRKKHRSFWQPITQSILAQQNFPNNTQISLSVAHKAAPTDGSPQIIINQSGDITPFNILMGKQNEIPLFQITGKANGEVTHAVFTAE